MSGRFAKLELQERTSVRRVGADEVFGTPVRTAQHDLALAVESWRAGHFETALQMYTRALRGDRAMVPAWVGQVQMLVELGEYPEARLWADKALELFKNNGDLLAGKAQACQRQGDLNAATVCSDLSLQALGSSPLRWQARAETLLRSAAARARDCFEKSLAEPGADWFDRVLIARIYLHHRQAAAALRYAQQAVELHPAHPYAWLTVGRCQAALGMNGPATLSFERSMQLPGGQADAGIALRELRGQGKGAHIRNWIGGLFGR